MWLKFRKRITVFPGFTLNLSKSWISSTIGVKGLSVNFNKTGQYLNVWLPGTWIYDRIKIWWSNSLNVDFQNTLSQSSDTQKKNEIESLDVWLMSDEIWNQIKMDIKESFDQRKVLKMELDSIIVKIFFLNIFFFLGWFLHKWYSKYLLESKWMLAEFNNAYANTHVRIDVIFDDYAKTLYEALLLSFQELSLCSSIWDITSAQENNGISDRTGANRVIERKKTSIKFEEIDSLKADWKVLKFQNKNGGDIFISPWHVVIMEKEKIDIFDIRKLNMSYFSDRMIEEESIPWDAKVIDYTWQYVNKSWWADKRYKKNSKIPIVEYGKLCLDSSTWLYEEFVFSDSEKLDNFWYSLKLYLNYLQGNGYS